MRAIAAAALLASGCVFMHAPRPAGLKLTAAPPSPECEKLDARVMGLNLAAIITGGLGSGAAAVSLVTDDQVAKYSLAGGGAGLGLAGAITGYLQGVYAARYVKKCTQAAP